jgi:uncharacterized protein YegP (UPF0339 family)
MAGKFEIYKDKKGEFRFRLKASNGEPLLASEGYKDRSGAMNGVASVKKNSQEIARYVKKTATNGKPFFVLRAGNHQVIGTSEIYENEAACDNGIKAVKAHAFGAEVEDLAAKA